MYKLKLFDNFARAGEEAFDPAKYTLSFEAEDPDGILVRSTPIHDVQFGPNLKSVVRVGAGFNTIPVERLTKMGVAVFNCPGGNANAVKELTIAGIIMAMRNGINAMEWIKSLPPEETETGGIVEKGKEAFRGAELLGKTMGILGVGAIGSRMAKLCHDMGMKVIGYDPYLSHARMQELSQYLTFVSDMDELLAASDVITVHVPLNPETRGFIGAKEIAKMKDGVYIANYARGPIVDNDELVKALDSGKVKAYATDFPTPEEMRRNDVVFSPHLASGTPEAEANCAIMAAHQTIDYLENGNISNSINLPDVSFARADGDRLTIIHENKVGMLGQFTDKVVAHELNIENLVNKGKEGIAYTIFDFNTEVPESLAEDLRKIDGVYKVRVIKQ